MQYLRGTTMPCDGCRHTQPISHLTLEEQNSLGFENGQVVYIHRIYKQGGSVDTLLDEILAAATADRDRVSTNHRPTEGW